MNDWRKPEPARHKPDPARHPPAQPADAPPAGEQDQGIEKDDRGQPQPTDKRRARENR